MNDEFKKHRDLRLRTKEFALRVIRLYSYLAKGNGAALILARQVLRSGTSVGAHYREATRARSPAEFVSKMEVGLQELEETVYWLELLAEAAIVKPARLLDLRKEAEELTAIFAASVNTAKRRKAK